MSIKYLFTLMGLGLSVIAGAQHGGNAVRSSGYGNSNAARPQAPAAGRLFLTDSTFLIEANVLANVIADSYVAVFGLAEESATVADCNEKIDKRAEAFIAELGKLGIARQDIYVDMTTQTKILDYKLSGSLAEQYLKGFELKKNVIVKFKRIGDLDGMVLAAAAHQIYDLVKVDYEVSDINKVYVQLFQAAMEVINQKKGLYIAATGMKLQPVSQVYGEDFTTYYPAQLYRAYTAEESSEVYGSYSNYTRKDLNKGATYYYDRASYSGFDKVLNPTVTEPAVEFMLLLQLKFQLEKSKK